MKVFYAWQSDSDEKCNRYFIRDALKLAIKPLADQPDIQDAPELDHDTKGTPGSPHIADTIAQKIRSCGVFVGDLSFVAQTPPRHGRLPKLVPNPNVLIELGLAATSIGWERIVMVMNTVHGTPDQLPFDLRHRRFPIQFALPSEHESAEIKLTLADELRTAIRAIISSNPVGVDQLVKVDCRESFLAVGAHGSKVLSITATNAGERPVVITSVGLLRDDNHRIAFLPLSVLNGWPLPKRLQEAEYVTILVRWEAFGDFIPQTVSRGLKITHAYVTDSLDNTFTVLFSEKLMNDVIRDVILAQAAT